MAKLDFRMALMPPLIQRISRMTGTTLAIQFARTFGGQRLYIPKSVYSAHPLVRCLGLPASQLVSRQYGGEYLLVPSGSNYLTWLDTHALCVCGLSQPDIARKLGITLRHANRLLSGFQPDTIEINEVVRSVARHYGVGARVTRVARVPRPDPQTDLGFVVDARGMRLTGL